MIQIFVKSIQKKIFNTLHKNTATCLDFVLHMVTLVMPLGELKKVLSLLQIF